MQPTALQWLLMAGVALSVVSAQTCFLQAMRAAEASFTMPFFYTTLIVAALWDLALFAWSPANSACWGARSSCSRRVSSRGVRGAPLRIRENTQLRASAISARASAAENARLSPAITTRV